MKLNRKKIALASIVAALIALPFLVFGGDLQTGNASTITYETGVCESSGVWHIPTWTTQECISHIFQSIFGGNI